MTETQATYMIDLLERILFIAGKFEAVLDAEQEDEDPACPTCGADGGTTCGAVNCDY